MTTQQVSTVVFLDELVDSLTHLGRLPILLGALIFSVSLYVLALSGVRWLGAITPIGGVLMIVGLVLAALDGGQR